MRGSPSSEDEILSCIMTEGKNKRVIKDLIEQSVGDLYMDVALRSAHSSRQSKRCRTISETQPGQDPTFFYLSRRYVEEIMNETIEDVLEHWNIQGAQEGKAPTSLRGEAIDLASLNCFDKEFNMEVDFTAFTLLGHMCEKYIGDLSMRSLTSARRRRSRRIEVEDIHEATRKFDGAVHDDRPPQSSSTSSAHKKEIYVKKETS
jgi:hypothetical protein